MIEEINLKSEMEDNEPMIGWLTLACVLLGIGIAIGLIYLVMSIVK